MSAEMPLEAPHSREDWLSISRQVLTEILDPCSCLAGSPMSLYDLGLVQEVSIQVSDTDEEPDTLKVRLALTDPMCMYFIDMAEEIRTTISGVGWPGAISVDWDTSVDWSPSMMSASGQLQIVEVKRQRFESGTVRPFQYGQAQEISLLGSHES